MWRRGALVLSALSAVGVNARCYTNEPVAADLLTTLLPSGVFSFRRDYVLANAESENWVSPPRGATPTPPLKARRSLAATAPGCRLRSADGTVQGQPTLQIAARKMPRNDFLLEIHYITRGRALTRRGEGPR